MSNLRSLPLCVLASAILCATTATAQKITPAVRIVNQIDESQLVPLKGTVHSLANSRNDRGAASADLQLERMHLVLTRSASQETALKQLISEMHTSGNANYHKWLTPAQFGAQFGPSDQDIATVTTWLTSHGFSVTGVNPGKQTLEFSGSASQLRSAFHTQIHKYQVNGETHYANAGDPQIPAALASVVGGFVSLNNFRLKRYSHYLGKADYDPKTDKATPQWTIGGGAATTDRFVLAPGDFAVQYNLNPLYTAGTTGAGQTIAIVNDSNINVALANQFRSLFFPTLSANPPQVIIDGNDPGVDGINNPDGPNYDSSEAYIDVEWAGAVAPYATIDLVVAADTSLESGLLLAAEHAVYSNVAPVISLSFGNCEANLGSSYNSFLNNLWEQAAAQGITVLVSSGDAGSATCDNDNSQYYAVNGQAVNGFASTPYNVAVGGTDFYYSDYASGGASIANYWNTTATNTTPSVSIKGVIPEQPWNDSQFGLNLRSLYTNSGGAETSMASGGGGSSAVYTSKPAWQTGFGDTVRDLPDVSLFAANGFNYSYYPVCAADGDCQSVTSGTVQISGYGGTSVASPAFAGIMALVNQKYGRQGQANTVLYPLNKQYPAAFHDVTAGSNSVPCSYSPASTDCIAAPTSLAYSITDPSYGTATEGQIGNTTSNIPDYNAAVGYDEATGLGSVDASVLVTDWNKVSFASTGTTLAISSSTFTHDTSVTISGKVTGAGTPTGDVALMTDSTEPLNQAQTYFTLDNTGSYSSSIQFLPGGTYNIWAHYGGDANNASSDSAKTQITVNPEASTAYFTILDVSSAYTNSAAINSGTTNLPYGTQLILSAQVLPTAYYNKCVNVSSVPTSCNSFYYTYPSGTVAFADGGTTVNTAVINAAGDAEYNAPWSVGSHSVTANYSGDKSYAASTGAPVSPFTFSITSDTPDIYLSSPTSTSSTVGAGQPTVFTVGIENSANYQNESYYGIGYSVPVKAPTGTVTVSGLPSGSTTSATLSAAVDPSTYAPEGVATIIVPATASAGTYTVKINYVSGDSNYASTSGSGSVTITAATGLASTTAVTSSTGSISPTTTMTVSGTVTGHGTTAPTGTVEFYSSGYSLGSVSITPTTSGASTFTDTLSSQTLYQGSNLITVQYSGDATYAPSSTTLNPVSSPLSDFTLTPNTTIVPVTAGSNATDIVNLASVNGFSGAVNFTCTAATGVTCSISSPVTLASAGSGTATLTIAAADATAAGTYNVLVTGQDSTGQYVHTLAISATVSAAPYYPTTTTSTLTVTSGSTTGNTVPITIKPGSGGYNGTVALTCSINPTAANHPATCALSPASVTLSGTASQTSTLTITTTKASALNKPLQLFWPSTGGAVLALAFFFGIPKRRRNWLAMLGLLVLFVSGAGIGCGGGSGSSSGGSSSNSGTTPGTYTVTVTATATATGSVPESTTFTLVVN